MFETLTREATDGIPFGGPLGSTMIEGMKTMELKETACWPAKVTNQHPHDPLRQRVCRVVMYARRAEIQAEARSFAELKGFMPEITDPAERYHAAIKMVCEIWFFLGPQEIELSNNVLTSTQLRLTPETHQKTQLKD